MKLLTILFLIIFSTSNAYSERLQRTDPIAQSDSFEQSVVLNRQLFEIFNKTGQVDKSVQDEIYLLLATEIINIYQLDPDDYTDREQIIRLVTEYILQSEEEARYQMQDAY